MPTDVRRCPVPSGVDTGARLRIRPAAGGDLHDARV